jgi:antitoxin (DNA-binding transcriptional repressor) of toxin-antitoxin stability system
MQIINASEFKAKCLQLLEKLPHEGIIILKRGKPIAQVQPIIAHDNGKLVGIMKGKIRIKGDILSTGVKWSANLDTHRLIALLMGDLSEEEPRLVKLHELAKLLEKNGLRLIWSRSLFSRCCIT